MSLYQSIAILCDSLNPLLFAGNIALLIQLVFRQKIQRGLYMLGCLFAGLAITYSAYFLDRAMGLWPRFGSDYSTHTAAAMALALPLALFTPYHRWLILTLLIYAALMVFQGYHSVLDIATTALAFSLLMCPILIAGRWAAWRSAVV